MINVIRYSVISLALGALAPLSYATTSTTTTTTDAYAAGDTPATSNFDLCTPPSSTTVSSTPPPSSNYTVNDSTGAVDATATFLLDNLCASTNNVQTELGDMKSDASDKKSAGGVSYS